MKLLDLIEYLTDFDKIQQLYASQHINTESEAILIYMKESLNLESEIAFFAIEETNDDQLFEKNGIKYIQLFPVDYAVQLIESDLNLKDNGFSNLEIANRLLEYRINDA